MNGEDSESGWLRTAAQWIAGASIVLVIVNIGLVVRNQAAQGSVTQRQAVLNQAPEIARVNQLLVETIARTALQKKDQALIALLERHGVKLNPTPPAATSPPTAASPSSAGKTP